MRIKRLDIDDSGARSGVLERLEGKSQSVIDLLILSAVREKWNSENASCPKVFLDELSKLKHLHEFAFILE